MLLNNTEYFSVGGRIDPRKRRRLNRNTRDREIRNLERRRYELDPTSNIYDLDPTSVKLQNNE